MRLLKTNTKQYKENFKNYFNTLFLDHENENITNINSFLIYSKNEWNFTNNKKRIPNLQARFADYLQGLPYGFSFAYRCEILELAAELHELKKVPENKEDIIIKNFYNHCSAMFLKLADKEIINKLY